MKENKEFTQYGGFIEMSDMLVSPDAVQEGYVSACELLGKRLAKRLDVIIAEAAVKFGEEKCAMCRKFRKGKCSGSLMTPCRKSKRAVKKGLKMKLNEMEAQSFMGGGE